MAPGQKKKKKVVIKVVKKKTKAQKDGTPTMGAVDRGSGPPHDPPTVPMSSAEAFDQYALICGNVDKHRLMRQNHQLDDSGNHVSTLTSTEGDTQPATLHGTDIQEPRQYDQETDNTDMPADETAGKKPDATTVEKEKEKPDDTIEEKPGDSTTENGTTGAHGQDVGEAGNENDDGEWDADWTSWRYQKPWSWEKWTDYGAWGASTWSGDYWKGDYGRAQSFDSQRSDLTSPDWLHKTFGRMDTQDLEDEKDRYIKLFSTSYDSPCQKLRKWLWQDKAVKPSSPEAKAGPCTRFEHERSIKKYG